jgi:hypothetical protein
MSMKISIQEVIIFNYSVETISNFFLIYLNSSGDLVILDFLLNENIEVKVNSIIKTNEIQTFNSIAKCDSSESGYVKYH